MSAALPAKWKPTRTYSRSGTGAKAYIYQTSDVRRILDKGDLKKTADLV